MYDRVSTGAGQPRGDLALAFSSISETDPSVTAFIPHLARTVNCELVKLKPQLFRLFFTFEENSLSAVAEIRSACCS